MESEENIINDIQGKTIEDKTSNIIKQFLHNEVSDKPRIQLLLIQRCDDKEKQKAILIESTQEDDSNLPSVGCRIRMLVGYRENGEMNATIITTKEEADYQFWYPKR